MVIYAYPFRGEASITTVSDIVVNDLFRNIFDYLKQTRRIRDIEDFDPEILSIWSREVLRKIRTGETGWEESLPTYVDNIIKEKGLFGYPKA